MRDENIDAVSGLKFRLGIPGHFMLADTGATMHLLLCLILAFDNIEGNRPVRGFNGSESICTRVSHLAFSAPVTYKDRQMDKSITSGDHDAYVTLDISLLIFSIARAATRSHGSFWGRHSRLVLERQYRQSQCPVLHALCES